MPTVTGVQLKTAFDRWREVTKPKQNHRTAFMKFLPGQPPLPMMDYLLWLAEWEVNTDAYDLIIALNSPHWQTLLKAHCIRQNLLWK